MKSYSQYCQDVLIDFLFNKKNNGIFLDIGANDGITISNTYLFEKHRNWSGLCIEPHIEIFKKCVDNRSCYLENCCIIDKEKTVIFRKIIGADVLSGIVEYMDDAHKKRIDTYINDNRGHYEDIEVQAKNINVLMQNII